MTRALTLLLAIAFPAITHAAGGQYTASSNGAGTGVWVVDTQSGAVKFCSLQRSDSGGSDVSCTPFVE